MSLTGRRDSPELPCSTVVDGAHRSGRCGAVPRRPELSEVNVACCQVRCPFVKGPALGRGTAIVSTIEAPEWIPALRDHLTSSRGPPRSKLHACGSTYCHTMMKWIVVPTITSTWKTSWYEKARGQSFGQFEINKTMPIV